MKKYILITAFGIAGAMCRYGMGLAMNGAIPWGTLTVNLIGCFLLPFVFVYLSESKIFSKELVAAIGTGFVGAFTTFSAFTVDLVKMIDKGDTVVAVLYLAVSLAGGLIAAYISVSISRYLVRKYFKKEEKRC